MFLGITKAFRRRPAFFYGWLVVGACLAVGIADASVANPLLSLFMKPMGLEFGWSRTMFSAVIFIAALPGSLLSITIGPLADRRGTRVVLAAGSAIIAACLVALSRVAALWHFYAVFGIARAVMGGATSLAIPVVVANWFVRKRGRAMGIAAAGTLIGSTLLPFIAQWLIDKGGWRFAWMSLGFMIAAVAIIPSALFVRRRPEDVGLLPDGAVSTDRGQSETLSGIKRAGSIEKTAATDLTWSRRMAMATSAFWLLTLAEAQASLCIGAINMHQFPYLTDVGISDVVAVGTVGLSSLVAIAGSLLWGLIAERVSARYCLILVYLAFAASIVMLMYARTNLMAYLFAVVWGLARGGMTPLLSITWAQYFGRISLASVRGISLPLHIIANAFGPIIAGVVYDTTASYQRAFIIFTAIFLCSSLWMFMARSPRNTQVHANQVIK